MSESKGKAKVGYMISTVARLYNIHPQTLRLYEREGLLKPSRTEGNTRLYTEEDLRRLEIILKLTREFGVNLAGVEIILSMREKMQAMQRQMEELVRVITEELARLRQQVPQQETGLIPMIRRPTPVRLEDLTELQEEVSGEPLEDILNAARERKVGQMS